MQVDPNMSQKSFGKLEDDVPAFYKRLKYPFQISKSSLFAVGSPHTWPGLLASLVWVTELLAYSEKVVCSYPLSCHENTLLILFERDKTLSAESKWFTAGIDSKYIAISRVRNTRMPETGTL